MYKCSIPTCKYCKPDLAQEGILLALIFSKDKAIEVWEDPNWKTDVVRIRPLSHFPDKRRRDDGTYKKHGTFFDKGDTPEKIND